MEFMPARILLDIDVDCTVAGFHIAEADEIDNVAGLKSGHIVSSAGKCLDGTGSKRRTMVLKRCMMVLNRFIMVLQSWMMGFKRCIMVLYLLKSKGSHCRVYSQE